MQTAVKKPVKRVLVVHSLCSAGKAALTNILPVLSVMGAEVSPVPSMVLSTHTGGYGKPEIKSLSGFGKACAGHLKASGFSFDAVFLGYLGSVENVCEAREILAAFPEAMTLFDPIMADQGSFYSSFDEKYGEALKGLLGLREIVTPNYTEACLLSGEKYEPVCSFQKLERIRKALCELGVKQAVVTSVPFETSWGIGIFENGRGSLYPYQKRGRSYPGTGDLFSAVLLGSLLQGKSLCEGVKKAHGFVELCIIESDRAGYDTREGVLLEPNLSSLI